jgi:hypothetical protein
MRLAPIGMSFTFQRWKRSDPMTTLTLMSTNVTSLRLSIRTVLVSQPPLGVSARPTNTTLEEPCHGSGLGCGLPGW